MGKVIQTGYVFVIFSIQTLLPAQKEADFP